MHGKEFGKFRTWFFGMLAVVLGFGGLFMYNYELGERTKAEIAERKSRLNGSSVGTLSYVDEHGNIQTLYIHSGDDLQDIINRSE